MEHSLENLDSGSCALLGLPWDAMSSFLRGPARAPEAIRQALNGGSANMCTESAHDLAADPRFIDAGDLDLSNDASALDRIRSAASSTLERGASLLCLGGDHAVTLGVLRAYAQSYERLNVLHFDAHPDLYDSYEGNRYSHACPFARASEEGLIGRLVQVGIRTMNPHQLAQAERFGVEVVQASEVKPGQRFNFTGPVYVSFDLDGLDPAFAPGVSHQEPGGLSTRDALSIIQAVEAPIVGADVVELNPLRDVNGSTAMVAAKLVKELAGKILRPS